jgi:hypothetical protein
MDMKTYPLHFSAEKHEQLRTLAFKNRMTLKELINNAISEYAEKLESDSKG